MTTQLRPFFEDVRAHCDLSNEFYALFTDPTMTYSCARFTRPDMTLAEAQIAKVDGALEQCGLRPGQRLLEIGFGWGYVLRRAVEKFGVRAVGLTLSLKQHEYVTRLLRRLPREAADRIDVRIQGWEEFDEPVDAIVSVEVFEAFRHERYPAFFERCRKVLPDGGRMFLQTNLWSDRAELHRRGLKVEHEHVLFAKFMRDAIFPGGMLCEPATVHREARAAGFEMTRAVSLRDDYVRTLDQWAANLESARAQAVALTSQQTYDNYLHYLTGCSKYFRTGHIDVMQFTLQAA